MAEQTPQNPLIRTLDTALTFVAGGVLAGIGAYYYYNPADAEALATEASGYLKSMPSCSQIAGAETADRVSQCLAKLPETKVSGAAKSQLETLSQDGQILTVGPYTNVPNSLALDASDTELVSALLNPDGQAAATVLRKRKIRAILIHRDIKGALDRDRATLARLAYRDHYAYFQLRRVTPEGLLYTVRSSSNRIPAETGDRLLKGLRARLAGRPAPKQTWTPSSIKVIGTMRLQGEMLAQRFESGSNIEQVLSGLADKLTRRWEREVAIKGIGSLEERLDDIRLEVHVIMDKAPLEPRDKDTLFELWEMGIDGMVLQKRNETGEKAKFTYFPGSEQTTRSLKSADQFLQLGSKLGGWRDRRPWEKSDTQLDIIRTQHFMESRRGGGTAVRLMRGMPEVPMQAMTDSKVRQMLVDGGEWWLHNTLPDGHIEYKYWPTQNRRSAEYNEVRHILAARDLADTYRYRNDTRYIDGSRKSMDWLMKYAVYHDSPKDAKLPHPPVNSMLFRYPFKNNAKKQANQKLGTVAVALLGWVAWADATGSHAEDDNIRKMAEFTKFRLLDNGKFDPYYVHRGHGYYGQKNDIVPGEAALALGMVAEYFNEKDWVDFYPKFINYYQPWFRERSVKKRKYGRWPHDTYTNLDRLDMVQFGPWSVMAAKQYYKLTGNEEAGAFGLEVADWMIDNYQWSGARSPWPDYVGGYYKLPNETPAMQSFCYSEGTAAAYQLASTFRPDEKGKYDLSTLEAIRFLEVMQFDDLDSYFVAQPDKVRGGIKYTMNENKIRIDYVGHGLSTLSQYLDAKEFDPAATLTVPDPSNLDDGSRIMPSIFNKPTPEPAE